jgi:hypothetical protein
MAECTHLPSQNSNICRVQRFPLLCVCDLTIRFFVAGVIKFDYGNNA